VLGDLVRVTIKAGLVFLDTGLLLLLLRLLGLDPAAMFLDPGVKAGKPSVVSVDAVVMCPQTGLVLIELAGMRA